MKKLFGNWMVPFVGAMTLLIALCGTSFATTHTDEAADANTVPAIANTDNTLNSGTALTFIGTTNPQDNSGNFFYTAETMTAQVYYVAQDTNGGLVPAEIVTGAVATLNDANTARHQASLVAHSNIMRKSDVIGSGNHQVNGGLVPAEIVTGLTIVNQVDDTVNSADQGRLLS